MVTQVGETACHLSPLQGFAFVEAGLLSSKNVVNILVKNFLDAAVGAICYWLIGFGLAFGDGNSFIGYNRFILIGMPEREFAFFFFQYTFAATAGTIVSGAIAERADLRAYLVYSVALASFIFPIATHWIWWPGGWLEQLGFLDFAGSGVVHALGGAAGLVGTVIVGPRAYRFEKDGKGRNRISEQSLLSRHAPHSIPFFVLGAFILWVGFLGFNGGSNIQLTLGEDGENNAIQVAKIITNTIISGASGCLCPMVLEYAFTGKWSIVATISGTIAGMAAVCAGVHEFDPWAAFVIGLVGGAVEMGSAKVLVRLRVDDPVEAVPIHLFAGSWGVVAAGLMSTETGLFYTGDFTQLGIQLLGITVIVCWSAGICAILFLSVKSVGILRVPAAYEQTGQDLQKHAEVGYIGVPFALAKALGRQWSGGMGEEEQGDSGRLAVPRESPTGRSVMPSLYPDPSQAPQIPSSMPIEAQREAAQPRMQRGGSVSFTQGMKFTSEHGSPQAERRRSSLRELGEGSENGSIANNSFVVVPISPADLGMLTSSGHHSLKWNMSGPVERKEKERTPTTGGGGGGGGGRQRTSSQNINSVSYQPRMYDDREEKEAHHTKEREEIKRTEEPSHETHMSTSPKSPIGEKTDPSPSRSMPLEGPASPQFGSGSHREHTARQKSIGVMPLSPQLEIHDEDPGALAEGQAQGVIRTVTPERFFDSRKG
uniref:Ammonium transporter n=1 Tax=Chromera velia CCMP2878 TaxID=1169474 RepID=A0A0G4HS75_9ALVE|eukprot:Cvel_8222.t1-p1 / transcript=Cvel_8222.t1 / gene=Cvel_8222 / organism=Chromera_velia_CCMP2878 / gene_product=Ammonium transporter 2, putative / transcript_product=Ammonium transporter 2, putative / location=Cvel_scaffold449:2132-8135(+) / protein_length=709 / sequence_SO=supercontig / SO=protein_coding / is_pseudo=false